MRATLRRGLRMVLFLTVPSTVGLALLGVPIIRLIYEHGRFSPHATLETARALSRLRRRPGRLRGHQGRGAGVLRARPHARAAHRQRRRRSPPTWSGTSLTFRRFGHVGLALGTSIAALVNCWRPGRSRSRSRSDGLCHARAARRRSRRSSPPPASWRRRSGLTRRALELLPGAGTADARRSRPSSPIAVGAVVYFAAARVLRPRGGGDAARAASAAECRTGRLALRG